MSDQPRHMSAVESVTNVTAGYLLALVTQAIVFPWFGIDVTASDHMAIAAVFTVISLVRSYAVRRAFNWAAQS